VGDSDNRLLSVNSGHIVRATHESDLPAALALVEAARLDVRSLDRIPEMLEDAVRGVSGEYHACIVERDGECAGVGVYGLVAGTVGTAALYAVVVAKTEWQAGTGRAIVAHVATDLTSRGVRLVVAELPGHESLSGYRLLLEKGGFVEESHVDDYYEDGVPLVQYRLELGRAGRAQAFGKPT
jgi:ribosomal protein S18 acetylase RimI-like enzyme